MVVELLLFYVGIVLMLYVDVGEIVVVGVLFIVFDV